MPKLSKTEIKQILGLWENFKQTRSQWMLHWEDLARLLLPRRIGFVTENIDGDRRTEDIYDSTPMRAARGLANAVSQLLRPESEKWVFIKAEEDVLNNRGEVQEWLKRAEDTLLAAMYNPKARLRQAGGEADHDIVAFGTACLFTGQSRTGRHLQYITSHLKDVTIAVNAEGVIDTVFQHRKFTLRQAMQKFGLSNLSADLQKRIDEAGQGMDDEKMSGEKFDFLRVVRPREDAPQGALLARNLPWADLWIEVDEKHEVVQGGFHEFPFSIPRWDTSSGEIYGRSPGMIALPDSETLNAMTETILISGQKAADPSIFAPNDSSFDAINSFSGGITYYDVDTATQLRGNPFFTIDQNFSIPITRDMQADMREQVQAAFFRNVFNLPVNGPEMTATEVLVRKEEFVREIGPVFGRLETDYLAPMVERSFSILLRQGEFGPIPEILQDQNIRFEYTSPINKIREQAQVAAGRLWLQDMTAFAQIDPEVIDNINADDMARFSARALDLPLGALRSEAEVEKKRKERKAAEADALERQKVGEEAAIMESGGKAAKSLTEAFAGVEAANDTQKAA